MKKTTKKNILNISIVVILIGIMILTLLNSTDELNYRNIKEYLTECNYGYLALAVLCWGGFILFEALSLKIILRSFGQKVKFRSAIAYSTADTYYSGITPSATGGQPASAYYMVKDGVSGGIAGFSLIFNLVGYTTAILIIGTAALLIGYSTFLELDLFIKILIMIGYTAQIVLLGFFLVCMCQYKWVIMIGHWIINVLHKFRIIRKKEKWLKRLDGIVEKYRSCYKIFVERRRTMVPVILCNIAQRASQILITVFVCKSAFDCNMWEIFLLQAFIVLGYNSLPLPGGIGAFEYLYMKIFKQYMLEATVVITMMVSRGISFYISIFASGAYTIVYHILQLRRTKKKHAMVEGAL